MTDTILPNTAQAFSNNWADFKLTCTVTDGQLTVRSGPNSQGVSPNGNNKICFIDITVPTPVAIVTQPRSVTTNETRRVIFSVAATGSTPITYQWYMYGPGTDPASARRFSRSFVFR